MAWQGMAGHINAGRYQPALEAALLDVVGMAQRSAHAGARGGVRVGRVTECAHSTTLRRVRRFLLVQPLVLCMNSVMSSVSRTSMND